MKLKLDDLLRILPREGDRQELLTLGRQLLGAEQAALAGGGEEPCRELLDQIMARLNHHFRAIRHPMPTRQEMAEILRRDLGEG